MSTRVPKIEVKPKELREFGHTVSKLVTSPNSQLVMVCGEGRCGSPKDSEVNFLSIVSPDLEIEEYPLGGVSVPPYCSASIDDSGRYLLKERPFEIVDLQTTRSMIPELDYQVDGCHFDSLGRCWIVGTNGFEGFTLGVYQRDPWEEVSRLNFKPDDRYTVLGNCTEFLPTGSPDKFCFLATDGQSSTEIFWAELVSGSQLEVRRLDALDGDVTPIVSIDCGQIIGLEEWVEPSVVRTVNPFTEISKEIVLPEFDADECNDETPEQGCFLDLVNVFIQTISNRFYVLHARSMEIQYEIVIEGCGNEWSPETFLPYSFKVCGGNLIMFLYHHPIHDKPFYVASIPIESLIFD